MNVQGQLPITAYKTIISAIQCLSMPLPPTHMIMNVTSVTFKSTMTLTCVEGYDLVGESARSCGSDGNWTNSSAFCKGINVKSMLNAIQ